LRSSIAPDISHQDELLDQVWRKTVVEEAALHVQVSALRKVLSSDAIATVSGRAVNSRCR
jgi:DNA-binding winged helix-turn-helix (wHTH) protein